jgi:hypothetical protein
MKVGAAWNLSVRFVCGVHAKAQDANKTTLRLLCLFAPLRENSSLPGEDETSREDSAQTISEPVGGQRGLATANLLGAL